MHLIAQRLELPQEHLHAWLKGVSVLERLAQPLRINRPSILKEAPPKLILIKLATLKGRPRVRVLILNKLTKAHLKEAWQLDHKRVIDQRAHHIPQQHRARLGFAA